MSFSDYLFKIAGKIAVENAEANEAIDETTDKAEQGSESMSGSFKKIGGAIASYFAVDKIIDFGREVVNTAAEVAAETSAFEQIMGDYTDEAAAKVGKIADATGMVDSRLTPYMTSMTAKFKGLGYDVEDATGYASRGLTLAADASAFWDKSLDESVSHLNSFINGSYEGGEAIGLFANDTQMAMYAVEQGLIKDTKEWANLDEATKQATRLEYAENMMKASGASGQAAKEAGQYANVQANLNEKWRQFKADIGEPLLQNIVIPAMSKLSDFVGVAAEKFQGLQKWVSENKNTLQIWAGIITGLATGIGVFTVAVNAHTIAMKAQTIATNAVQAAQKLLNLVMNANPIGIVIAAISALVAAFIYLWNNCEPFREFWINLWEKIKDAASVVADWFVETWEKITAFFTETVPQKFNSFKEKLSEIWQNCVDKVTSVFDTIKNAISVAIQFIGSLFSAAFQIITLPFRFIWENCKEYVFAAFEWIKEKINVAISKIKEIAQTGFNFVKEKIINPITEAKDKVVEKFNEVKEQAERKIQMFKMAVGMRFNEIKEKILTPITNAKDKVVDTFNNLRSQAQEKIDSLKEKVTSTFNQIKEKIQTPINNAKNKVAEIFNNLKTNATEKINSLKSMVTSKFNEIKQKIQEPIEKAKDKIKEMIDKIKGFFDNLKLKLPHIKLPHFKLTGEFSLENKTVPHLSIEWYKKAMNAPFIMNSPTIFGYNNATDSYMGGGEAGSEVVSGVDTLMNMIRAAVSSENSAVVYYLQQILGILAEFFPEVLEKLDFDFDLDDDRVIKRIAPGMDRELGIIAKRKARGG